ncbi:hydantoinase/carbamoylase family amidase [Lichenibacterium minor]|uniref:Hydantoinase/carbamoylase family amidase n=1 Tax=Lichenibacterium minor TaxID=2316528 RepID=A0A4Q2TY73_9HYPH|nr:hydantoinase/carbamoylase family amidase [Lichenibacterium minor]RYC29033.1 hydantoinase/carbamoylase family amidase [Lichenibacterium minor]
MITVDTRRFLADLDHLRTIGTYRTGVHRPTFGAEDMESRRWLLAEMDALGLDARMDGIGNLLGRHRGSGPRLLVGSHIETQDRAGWLDGALGVTAALALARAGLPVDVGVYADEEGHWGNMLGSRSLVGDLDDAEIDAARDRDGVPLRDALARAGLVGLPRMALEPGRYRGALEIHIEQGTQLERRDQRIGVVTGIVGLRAFLITFEGQQDHTGGTTMAERRDAALSAVRLLAAIDAEFPKVCGDHSVWTAGRIVVEPNQPAVIPGRCEVSFSFRDLSDAVLDRMEACLRALVRESDRRERCPATIEAVARLKPEPCDPGIVAAFEGAADALCPGAWRRMQSGALHDSQVLASRLPVGMLFVPSIGGISHHWTEDTTREDLELGCRVMAAAAERLLG